MGIRIVCKQSAFKHGITEDDIRRAFNTVKYDNLVEGFENKYLLIGFDTHGNLLEVMYGDLGENVVSVFHAMKCRKALLSLLTRYEETVTDMTEEEANALDEYFTQNLPKVVPGKGGVTTRQGFRMVAVDYLSEDYLLTMALATKKPPTEIISELIREKIAV